MNSTANKENKAIVNTLSHWKDNIPKRPEPLVQGQLVRMVGMLMEAEGCRLAVGNLCLIETRDKGYVQAEVIGFNGQKTYLMPLQAVTGILPYAKVLPTHDSRLIPIGDGLLGRVIDGLGSPLDLKGDLVNVAWKPVGVEPINPLHRAPISEPLDVGNRAINGLLTLGRGQRLGLFAGSGVGKSTLLGMLTRHTAADIIVVGLIGERGREVQEFITHILGDEGMKKAVVIASPADDPSMMKIYGADTATAIAEYYRDQGKSVLLLLDSLTRYAQAQREISLSVGELPATKGYTPTVFAKIPKLVERAGNGPVGMGSITAIYTVLVEGDDLQDPIADSARAILDGHIVLSRRLAEEGIYPALDIEASISRAMTQIISDDQLSNAQRLKQLYSLYHQNKDLIRVGAYQPGVDVDLDIAIRMMPKIKDFIIQDLTTKVDYKTSINSLKKLIAETTPAAMNTAALTNGDGSTKALSSPQAPQTSIVNQSATTLAKNLKDETANHKGKPRKRRSTRNSSAKKM